MHAECIKLTSDVFKQRVPSRASDVLEGAEFCSGKKPVRKQTMTTILDFSAGFAFSSCSLS